MVSRPLPIPIALACLALLVAPAPAQEAKLRVCLISGSEGYESDRTLAGFAQYLEANFPISTTILKAAGTSQLPGLDALDSCDVALLFTRRLTLPEEQVDRIRAYVDSGRPLVAVRTASHGIQNWLAFDHDVLGGNYQGHYRNDLSQRTSVAESAANHPLLIGVGSLASRASLYKTSPLAPDCTLIHTSTTPEATEPATWTRERDGQRIVYTSLGAQGDFDNASFLRLLANALHWAAKRDVPPEVKPRRPPLRPATQDTLRLTLRSRVEPFKGSGQWEEVQFTRDVPVRELGVVICDMWDLHWCRGATERADLIALRMEPVLDALRKRGVQIVHAPSETMDFYRGSPQRLRAQLAPRVPAPPPPVLPPEPPLPIDDLDGGCDTDDAMYLAWTRQNPRIRIAELDAVSDNGDEIYALFREQGVKYILMMGVHINMCVLNRTFAIKEMTRRGMQCILVRDLTDTMYDPRDRPFVPHDQGTALVVEHIEKYWAPSMTSDSLLEPAP